VKRRVRLTALAKADIQQASAWYEDRKPGLGAEFLDKVDETIGRIKNHPLAFRTVIDDLRRANVERFPFGIWFVIEPSGNVVVACLHAKRDLRLAKKRGLDLEP
jgi:toxin ParE1/3/4